jgi:uncharacterized membrane protein YphA (DoxX/SURF4 family)
MEESTVLEPAVDEVSTPAPPWPLAQRIFFRFVFIYFVLYSLPQNGRVSILGVIPGAEYVIKPYTKLWHALCPWIAIHWFHLSGQRTTYFPTGSGDTTLSYIENLSYVVLALAGMLLWSVLDRRRLEYRTLNSWLRLLVRYTLAFTLFAYGFAKVFPLQFQPPGFSRLIQHYGDFSPMGVLWSFMGASIPYTIFSGAAETLGGLLLLFRRTTTLGALVAVGVLANVVALNFCYDVPVKLYSSNLLLMAAYLAAADAHRLVNLFLLNRPTAPVNLEPAPFERRWLRLATMAFWVLFVGYELYSEVHGGWTFYKETYFGHPSPLSGLYEADSKSPWKEIEFLQNRVTVHKADDSVARYNPTYDAISSNLTLGKAGMLHWSRADASHLALNGELDGSPFSITLHQIDKNKYLLMNRGFHWISEMPFNR